MTPRKGYKIVLGTSVDEYEVLLRLKSLLGDRFYVRSVDNRLEGGFTVAFFEEDIEKLDDSLRARVVPMWDEGIYRPCVPFLYRFLPDEFIDDFVHGKVRLSTFNRCKSSELVARSDGREGAVEFWYEGHRVASASAGENGYLLCTSLTPFASGSAPNGRCVIIIDSIAFMEAVTAALRRKGRPVSAIIHGPCVYTDHRVSLSDDPEHTPENLIAILDRFGDRIYMMKDARPNFMVEHEYRMLWLVDEVIEDQTFDVELEHPERYMQAMVVPDYYKLFPRGCVAARNHPCVIRHEMLSKEMKGKIITV